MYFQSTKKVSNKGTNVASEREQELASYEETLKERSGNCCELCTSTESLSIFEVPPVGTIDIEKCAYLCSNCKEQVSGAKDLDTKHWFCLNDSAWSSVPAVQALAYRTLKKLETEDWAQNLSEQLYMEDDVREWAEAGLNDSDVATKDSNGVLIEAGDTVTLIKDLDVKGTTFVAKRGTVVKNVRITGNGEHVEGRVNGTTIFLKASFLKKM